jgi:hypothetical protein
MASLSPPIGRRGRGPFRNGARAEVIATAGESSVERELGLHLFPKLILVVKLPNTNNWTN